MQSSFIKELFCYIFGAMIVWLMYMLIVNTEDIHRDIIGAIDRCLNVMIPSLFGFMALSGIITKSGIYRYLSLPFHPIAKYIFGMPAELFLVFIMGNVAGYPVGNDMLKSLVIEDRINKKTAEIFSCFCYGGGPAFFTGAIGLAVFGSSEYGMIIFASSLSANALAAIILCHIFKCRCTADKEGVSISPDTIVSSVISAGRSMFVISSTIVFFAVITSVLDANGVFDIVKILGLSNDQITLIKSVLEISNVSELSGSVNLLPYIAAVCSFGGICVLLQIKAIVGDTYSLKSFLIARVLIAAASGGICKLILYFYTPKAVEAAAVKAKAVIMPDNVIPSVCLIGMTLILFMHKKAEVKNNTSAKV